MFFKKKEPKWWEKEAEEHYMTADEYLKLLKLEKENAELELLMLKKKEDARSRREKWDDYQAEQFEKAKEKIKGYEQLAKVHSAYISILLNKLGATKDNTITINAEEVTKAMEKYEARAMYSPENKSYSLYCEVIE